jgi:DNA modification methylase
MLRIGFIDQVMDSLMQLSLGLDAPTGIDLRRPACFADELAWFEGFGTATIREVKRFEGLNGADIKSTVYTNEYWTARQRQASSLQEISYRACFKPQLPRFFIERLTQPGQVVYDPFLGRGTTAVEAALLGRIPYGCDVNPLSRIMTIPRLNPPTVDEIKTRLEELDLSEGVEWPEELLVFYHPDTLREIVSLKEYLLHRTAAARRDLIDDWIAMVALNRLTGHSAGFFSVYTLPPNQAVSVKSQIRINQRRNQSPSRRQVKKIILRKSAQLLSDCEPATRDRLRKVSQSALVLSQSAASTPQIPAGSVQLVVTSPPFLNVVDYATDNWLRCWFLGIDARAVPLTVPKGVEEWQLTMSQVFRELSRVLACGGHIAFEVGEVQRGRIRLEEAVVPCGLAAGLELVLVMINQQEFTKTAHCWGVSNNSEGTNTNRIVLFRKP